MISPLTSAYAIQNKPIAKPLREIQFDDGHHPAGVARIDRKTQVTTVAIAGVKLSKSKSTPTSLSNRLLDFERTTTPCEVRGSRRYQSVIKRKIDATLMERRQLLPEHRATCRKGDESNAMSRVSVHVSVNATMYDLAAISTHTGP